MYFYIGCICENILSYRLILFYLRNLTLILQIFLRRLRYKNAIDFDIIELARDILLLQFIILSVQYWLFKVIIISWKMFSASNGILIPLWLNLSNICWCSNELHTISCIFRYTSFRTYRHYNENDHPRFFLCFSSLNWSKTAGLVFLKIIDPLNIIRFSIIVFCFAIWMNSIFPFFVSKRNSHEIRFIH